MGFLGRRRQADIPPLVEAPKAGEPIVFDEEEQRAIEKEIKYQYDNFYKDRIFPKDIAEKLQNGFAARALREIAKSKLSHGDLKGAASTCIKLLGLSAIYEGDWLLLAEIFAKYGDTERARGFIETAKKVHKKNKTVDTDTPEFESVWKNMVNKVQQIIKSKKK